MMTSEVSTILELFWRFVVISVLAFGGGQSALPLVERMVVADTGWLSPQDFSSGLAFTYVTPGPVLVLATFVGYRVAGLAGALAATLGVFTIPWILATLAAKQLQTHMQNRWLRGFGRGAGPAMVGLLLVSAFSVAQSAFISWGFVSIGVAALALSLWRKVHVFFILAGSALLGAVLGMAGPA